VRNRGFFQTGRFQTFPVNPASVGTPLFSAALVLIVEVEARLLVAIAACGTGIFVAPPIRLMPGRLLA
jgi:hypothetical protein